MSTDFETAAGCIVLSEVPWGVYTRLRAEPANRNVRMTYDRGMLEIMSPSRLHERIVHLLGRMVDAWTEERGIAVQGCGAMTFRREDLNRGLEPDRCYYVASEAAVRMGEELDLSIDPPPDLVIEVDVRSTSAVRMPIYGELGIPEAWRWTDDLLEVHQLGTGSTYHCTDDSRVLPGFPFDRATQLLCQRNKVDETTLIRNSRSYVRDHCA